MNKIVSSYTCQNDCSNPCSIVYTCDRYQAFNAPIRCPYSSSRVPKWKRCADIDYEAYKKVVEPVLIQREGWINVYPRDVADEMASVDTSIYNSKEAAKANAYFEVIDTVKIVWIEKESK